MAIVIVHGINTHGGGIDQFGLKLQTLGYDVRFYEYQKRHFWSYWNRRTMAQDVGSLINQCDEGDDIICHSNGAVIWQESIKAGFKWRRCMVFGGAGTSDQMIYPPDAFESARVYYNPEDTAIKWGARIPWHPFGKLGRIGYAGPKDKRITNVSVLHEEVGSLEHSHYFEPPFFGRHIEEAKEFLGNPNAE